MALHQFVSLSICLSFKSKPKVCTSPISIARLRRGVASCPVRCLTTDTEVSGEKCIGRRSANHQPPIWHLDYIESLGSEYKGQTYDERVENLKEEVRGMFKKLENDHLAQLEHVDILQRLGLSYHYGNEIKSVLQEIYTKSSYNNMWKKSNLYATALEFRLLRQHGYLVPQEVFSSFKDETGKFRACICDDTKAILSMYEASFLMTESESVLEEARDFAIRCLEEYVENNKLDSNDHLSLLVSHALEFPLHWRMLRLETRWFIDVYEKRKDMNSSCLSLLNLTSTLSNLHTNKI